jgi:hypothetical protein
MLTADFMDRRQFDLVGILTAVRRSLPEPRHSLPAATRASPYRPNPPTTVGHILIRRIPQHRREGCMFIVRCLAPQNAE